MSRCVECEHCYPYKLKDIKEGCEYRATNSYKYKKENGKILQWSGRYWDNYYHYDGIENLRLRVINDEY